MRSKKITATVLGIVLTLGLVVSGCGNSGTSSDGSAKAETKKDGYQVVNIGFPSGRRCTGSGRGKRISG